MPTPKTFEATVESRPNGGVAIRVPFDPSAEWGAKDLHHVTGTIGGRNVRGTVTVVGGERYLLLGQPGAGMRAWVPGRP